MISSLYQAGTLSVSPARTGGGSQRVVIPVANLSVGAVQLVWGDNVTGSPVVTIAGSIDGVTPNTLKFVDNTDNTLTATAVTSYLSPPLDLTGTAYLIVYVSTDGTLGTIDVWFIGRAD